ncbi:ribonuclease Y-like isoform X1 [Pimephales promelas]|uniref:ribonuclease Y-like isoform X1 n=1 Tax=Pimephales promelas TaxID=90988 RepID=UPI001955733E|nr:ribonuclease Y-like isoform X1 [Pimephales promelas]XP_039517008.1 ribonuclease Y-like isoform X1 [Pimephales promelas]KAG1932159.1 hypothetical protein F2P79_021248 [Pimephales promelas]
MGAANSSESEKKLLKRRATELDKRSKEMDKRAEELDKREKELEKKEKELEKREKELDKGVKELKKRETELKKSGGMSLLRHNSGESETPNNCGCWYNQTAEQREEEPYSFFCQNTGCAAIRSPSPGSILTKLCCCC